jgi:hypothetical protein
MKTRRLVVKDHEAGPDAATQVVERLRAAARAV